MTEEYTFKFFEGEKWVKIFSHDYNVQSFFTESEALHCNQQYKYSILDTINSRNKIKQYGGYYYEFLYEYTKTDSSLSFVRWIQSNNPLQQDEEIEGSNKVPGFRKISKNFEDDKFGGLAKTTMERYSKGYISSLLNGIMNNSEWYYAIGIYPPCEGTDWNYDYIPASQSQQTKIVFLWMRVLKQLTCQKAFHIYCSIIVYLSIILDS